MDDRNTGPDLSENVGLPSEFAEDEASGARGTGAYFGDILERRVKRRAILKGAGAMGVGLVMGSGPLLPDKARAETDSEALDVDPGERIRFRPIEPSSADQVIVANNYSYHIIARWGDPLSPNAPAFDLNNQTRGNI